MSQPIVMLVPSGDAVCLRCTPFGGSSAAAVCLAFPNIRSKQDKAIATPALAAIVQIQYGSLPTHSPVCVTSPIHPRHSINDADFATSAG